jgi:hypothetical protein
MPNIYKTSVVETLRRRFGEIRKIPGSQSLFSIGEDAARIYFRYSRVHPGGRTFFGLREVDLRQLEGYNSFLCFLLDDGSPPLFIPYADFEEVFRRAETAKDGQYKLQLLTQRESTELYIARQGRFNVEGYVGVDALEASLDARRLRHAHELSHSQVQTLLAAIGYLKGYQVRVPDSDVGKLDWSITTPVHLMGSVPAGYDRVAHVLSEIDVIWVAPGSTDVAGLFEVEHSTPIYTGLLRFNDILLVDRRISRFSVVSNDTRRAVFARQLFRPTFTTSGLAELTSFLEYANVYEWHARLAKQPPRPKT